MVDRIKRFYIRCKEVNRLQSEFVLFTKRYPIYLFILRCFILISFIVIYFHTLKIYLLDNTYFIKYLLYPLTLFIFFTILLPIETWLKNLDKALIRQKITNIVEYLPKHFAAMRLSKIIAESANNKEALQSEMHSSSMSNLINGTMQIASFLIGFFASMLFEVSKKTGYFLNLNMYKDIMIFAVTYLVMLVSLYTLAEIFKSYNLYYLQMFDYQIKYAEYVKAELL